MRQPARNCRVFLLVPLLAVGWPITLAAQQSRTGDPRAIPPDTLARLVSRLQDADPAVSGLAQHRLRRLGAAADGAIPSLVALATAPSAAVRYRAVEALGAIGSRDSASIAALARAAGDPDSGVRGEALSWLNLLKGDAAAAVPALVPLLRASDPETRWRAAAALGNIGVPAAAVPSLLELLRDPSGRVRGETAYALRNAPRPDLVVPALAAALMETDGDIVVNAALALGTAGRALPAQAVPPLAEIVRGARASWIKAEAARALGLIGRPATAAIPALAAALSGDDASLRGSAAWAIYEIIGPRVTGEGTCKHRPAEGPIPTSVTFEGERPTIRGDAPGPYEDGRTGVSSSHGVSFNLQLRRPSDPAQSARALVFDLGEPVPGSDAVPLGEVRDAGARFHAFYMIDADRVIWNTRDIPVGATVLSDRTQMNFSIDGVPHLLQMGPWALGDCEEVYAEGGMIHGEGTTQAQITRASESSYTIAAPLGSVARLWNHRDPASPADRGLYYVQFTVQLRPNQ